MSRIRSTSLIFTFLISILYSFSQNTGEELKEAIDMVTYDWDLQATTLQTYDGLSRFCVDEEYRFEVINLMNEVHHYDSVLYTRLLNIQRKTKDREVSKTIKDIETFEKEYNMKKMIHFLREECNARSDIERHAEDLKTEIGMESYDGQIMLVEIELRKYVSHITKRVDTIRKHVHHLIK